MDRPGPVEITFELPQDAKSAQVTITDPAGRLIRSLSTSNAAKGFNTVTWDGKTESGQTVPAGTYYFAVSGILEDKSTIAGQPCAKGKIEEVKYKSGRPYFSVGGREIAMDQVVKIMEPSREY
ncbi:MAG: flagellar hook assembly protein FlgD, partial [Desulfatiglandales bacterium]